MGLLFALFLKLAEMFSDTLFFGRFLGGQVHAVLIKYFQVLFGIGNIAVDKGGVKLLFSLKKCFATREAKRTSARLMDKVVGGE